jgi:hypothetical protein
MVAFACHGPRSGVLSVCLAWVMVWMQWYDQVVDTEQYRATDPRQALPHSVISPYDSVSRLGLASRARLRC